MGTATNRYDDVQFESPRWSRRHAIDAATVLAGLSVLIYLYLGVGELAAVSSGAADSGAQGLLFVGAALAVLGIIAGLNLQSMPKTPVYLAGIGVAGGMVVSFVDAHSLGMFTPFLGLEVHGGGSLAGAAESLFTNPLAIVAKGSQLGLLVVLTAVLLDEMASLGLFHANRTTQPPLRERWTTADARPHEPAREVISDGGPFDHYPGRTPAADGHVPGDPPAGRHQPTHSERGGQSIGDEWAPQDRSIADTPESHSPYQDDRPRQTGPVDSQGGHGASHGHRHAGHTPAETPVQADSIPEPLDGGQPRNASPHVDTTAASQTRTRRPPAQPAAANSHATGTARGYGGAPAGSTGTGGTGFGHLLSRIPTPTSWGLLVMRLSLAFVFFVFGFIKMWPSTPAEPIVHNTIWFLPGAEFFFILGFWEALVGVLLLWKRTIRIAAWLLLFQMAGTLLTLIAGNEPIPAWEIFPFFPSDLGVYVIKNWILLAAGLILVVAYSDNDVKRPPFERMKSPTAIKVSSFLHWLQTTWLPRHALTFARFWTCVLLIWFGVITLVAPFMGGMLEHKTAIGEIPIAYENFLGITLATAPMYYFVGVAKILSGIALLKDEWIAFALPVFTLYILVGSLAVFLDPNHMLYDMGYVFGIPVMPAPDFHALYFYKDLVVLGVIWVLYDADHEWDPRNGIRFLHGFTMTIFTWMGSTRAVEWADKSLRR